MSPASQADPLHVDRYIGGYLIANNTNQNRQYAKNFAHKKNKQHYGPPQQHHGVYQGGYGLFPQAANYCQNQNSWTGVPLISTANARRNRRPHQNHYQHHSAPFHRQPVQMLNSGSCNLEYGEGHLPLSRLALHTQGAPLILSRRYNNNNNNIVINNNNRKQNPCQNNYRPNCGDVRLPVNPDFVIRKFHETLPKDVSFECKKEQISSGGGSSSGSVVAANSANQNINQVLNLDSLSVTSDESSGSTNSETCLPRIIKPRKRRKKDRKPPTSGADKTQTSGDFKSEPFDDNSDKSTSNLFKCDDSNKPAEQKVAATDKTSEPRPTKSIENRGHASHEDAEDDSDDSSSLFEAISRCSPTMCQCKYCDPSGQAWTFDRLCFSSIFTSSELNFSSDSLQDKSSLFGDKDSALRRSWSEPCPGYSVNTPSIDRVSSPHRSDPNVAGACELEESINTKSCFGAIGTGRRINKSTEWKPVDTPPSPEHVPDILFKCFPSRGVSLHVSPAITSPGGHRDLEIKFFSVPEDIKSESEQIESTKSYRSDSKELQTVAV